MEYSLKLMVYDVRGEMDIPFILANWDESEIVPVIRGRKDDCLGDSVETVKASEKEVE